MTSFVETEISRGVAIIRLNRPDKRNALKRDFIKELQTCVDDVSRNESIRILRLEAAGSVFCAGMDLGEMQERASAEDGKSEWQKDSEVYCHLLQTLFLLPIPTVVALQGPVLAGGVGLVLACDMIIASNQSYFMLPEPMRGITAAMVTPLLMHRIGAGPATHLLLSGERMKAERAKELGLCYEVVSPDQLDDRVEELTRSVLTGSKSALSITKQHLNRCGVANIADQIALSVTVSAEARETGDAREGLAAFLEKRKPNWMPNEQ